MVPTTTANATPELLELVDFKWLMGTEGRSVHLERLQADQHYALQCLQTGAVSRCEPLRRCAKRLLAMMSH